MLISWCKSDIWTLSVFILINLNVLRLNSTVWSSHYEFKSVCHVLHLDKHLLIFFKRNWKLLICLQSKQWFIYWPFIASWHQVTVFFFSLYVQSVETPPLLRVHIGARPGHMVSQEKISCSFIDCSYLFWSTSRHLETHTHVVSGAMDKSTAVNELWNAWVLDLTVMYPFFYFRLSTAMLYQILYSSLKKQLHNLDSLFHLTLI